MRLRVLAMFSSGQLQVFFGSSSEVSEELPKPIRRKPEENMDKTPANTNKYRNPSEGCHPFSPISG